MSMYPRGFITGVENVCVCVCVCVCGGGGGGVVGWVFLFSDR